MYLFEKKLFEKKKLDMTQLSPMLVESSFSESFTCGEFLRIGL